MHFANEAEKKKCKSVLNKTNSPVHIITMIKKKY